jgi:SAM-dependent methyltransferase
VDAFRGGSRCVVLVGWAVTLRVMPERSDLDNRRGFDQAVERYERARHGYPPSLFDDLFVLLPAGCQVCEVGPGTGQATGDLLDRGAQVTAVELGGAMAHRLVTRFERHPGLLQVIDAPFEHADLADDAYDAVFSATAYHWVPTWAQTAQPARILHQGGVLAIVDTLQVDVLDDGGFWERVQPIFDRHGAGRRPDDPPFMRPDEVTPPMLPVLRASDRFQDVELRRYRWDQRYTAHEYGELHRTYSGWLAMPEAAGEALLADICAFIDSDYDGHIVRPLVITLLTGHRT